MSVIARVFDALSGGRLALYVHAILSVGKVCVTGRPSS